jgi:arylsulfatase
MKAPIVIPKKGAEGVIFALGGDAAGWCLFLWEGKLRFHYNFFGLRRYDVVSPDKLSPGKHMVEIEFTPVSKKPGAPANVVMSIDGKKVAKGHIAEQVPQRCGTECSDVGMDSVSPVCADYEDKGVFPFTGEIESVTFTFGSSSRKTTGMERLKLATRMD